LPWNLKEEIMAQMAFILEWGGKFVPIPEVQVENSFELTMQSLVSEAA